MADEQITLPEGALPPGEGQAYVDKMTKRAEGVAPGDDVKVEDKKGEEQPLLAGKYKTVDDLLKAHSELEKKLGQKSNEQPKKAEDDKAGENKEGEEEDKSAKKEDDLEIPEEAKDAKSITDKAGLDWNAVNTEFAEKGELSAESYAALEKVGIPRAMVDQYTAGIVATRTQARNDVLSSVGGADEYGKMTAWAAANFTAEEIADYNAVVNGKDTKAAKLVMKGLKARFEASGDHEPTLISGDRGSAVTGYGSVAEMKADMKKPEYAKDPAFRAQVAAKVRVSNI